ncbi:MAG: HAMP domain-containing histidine kinase [Chloroflexi bacterium]|nr:MAG: HAMP domain-containing histidine kinase [Chloroflexota bacterium]
MTVAPMSLRLRLLITLAPLFILGLVAADVGTYLSLQSFLVSRVDDQVTAGHVDVENQLLSENGFRNGGPQEGDGGGGPSTLPVGTYAELLTPSGSLVSSPRVVTPFNSAPDQSTHPVLPGSVTGGGAPASPEHLTVPGTGSVGRYRVYVEAARNGDILVVAIPLDDVDSTLNRLLLLEVGVTGGVTIVVLVATWFIVRRGLRPLERMGRTARSIVATDLGQRIAPATERTEVGRLGLALNSMLGELEDAFAERAASEQRLRHFVSDASHELRTPLTSMRGYAELLRRKPHMDREDVLLAVRRIEDETRRMGILVDDLLLLARLDQGRPLERSLVDLEALVGDACSDARAADPARPITANITAPLAVVGDEVRLRQAFGNLLRNAIVHTPAGTPVEVELTADDGQAVVSIVDHGPGIPAGHAQRVFERFHRADPGRSRDQGGSGLGLSITAAIVAAHGGTVSVAETPGGGATFRVALPLADPGAPGTVAEVDPHSNLSESTQDPRRHG